MHFSTNLHSHTLLLKYIAVCKPELQYMLTAELSTILYIAYDGGQSSEIFHTVKLNAYISVCPKTKFSYYSYVATGTSSMEKSLY